MKLELKFNITELQSAEMSTITIYDVCVPAIELRAHTSIRKSHLTLVQVNQVAV